MAAHPAEVTEAFFGGLYKPQVTGRQAGGHLKPQFHASDEGVIMVEEAVEVVFDVSWCDTLQARPKERGALGKCEATRWPVMQWSVASRPCFT